MQITIDYRYTETKADGDRHRWTDIGLQLKDCGRIRYTQIYRERQREAKIDRERHTQNEREKERERQRKIDVFHSNDRNLDLVLGRALTFSEQCC